MKPTAIALMSAVLIGGVVAASPAAADDPTVMGTYTFEAEDGESATWILTPCAGDAPGCARVAEAGNSKRVPWAGEAHYSVGSWILWVQQPDAILCEDGSAVPGRNTYAWDNATLAGSVSILSNGACGAEPESLSIPFRLTKTGTGPVQYPTAPIDAQPLAPALSETIAPAAPANPLPAESPASAPVPVIPPSGDQLTEAEVAQPGFR